MKPITHMTDSERFGWLAVGLGALVLLLSPLVMLAYVLVYPR